MSEPRLPQIWFKRAGRKRRGRGVVLQTDHSTGCVKLDPSWPFTKPLWVTPAEIAAGVKEVQPRLALGSSRKKSLKKSEPSRSDG
jgi:hypothetical protein